MFFPGWEVSNLYHLSYTTTIPRSPDSHSVIKLLSLTTHVLSVMEARMTRCSVKTFEKRKRKKSNRQLSIECFINRLSAAGHESKRWPEWFGKSGGLGGLGDPISMGTRYCNLSLLDSRTMGGVGMLIPDPASARKKKRKKDSNQAAR